MEISLADVSQATTETGTVRRIAAADFFANQADMVAAGWPFIITGMLEHLADEVQILEKIRREGGREKIHCQLKVGGEDVISIAQYLDMISASETSDVSYAANNILPDKIAKTLNLQLPIRSRKVKYAKPRLWIGAANTATFLHRDGSDNFSYQLVGSKEWTIYRVHEYNLLYFDKNDGGFSRSLIDVERQVNLADYPLFVQAKPIRVIVNPREVFYLPYGWGHSVKNLSLSVMVNYWFSFNGYQPLVLSARAVL